jgi:hypothetical protein
MAPNTYEALSCQGPIEPLNDDIFDGASNKPLQGAHVHEHEAGRF